MLYGISAGDASGLIVNAVSMPNSVGPMVNQGLTSTVLCVFCGTYRTAVAIEPAGLRCSGMRRSSFVTNTQRTRRDVVCLMYGLGHQPGTWVTTRKLSTSSPRSRAAGPIRSGALSDRARLLTTTRLCIRIILPALRSSSNLGHIARSGSALANSHCFDIHFYL